MADSANIYFSVSQGFRSGGMNFLSPAPYNPEKILSYEVGAKARLLTIDCLWKLLYTTVTIPTIKRQVRASTRHITSNPGEAEIQG